MKLALLLISFFITSNFLHAQQAPDAGSFRSQVEKELPLALPSQSQNLGKISSVAIQDKREDKSVIIKEISFSGNTLITTKELTRVVRKFLNKPLTFNQLKNAANKVADRYRQKGWVVQAYLPEQDITEGRLTINIVEAVFGEIILEAPTLKRSNGKEAIKTVERFQTRGEFINNVKLDRALLLLDDRPGLTASGSLAQGLNTNETDVILKLADEPLFNSSLTYDNSGSRSTGEARVSGNSYINNLFKKGDLTTVSTIHSSGNDYVRLALSLPVGDDGWRLGTSASYLEYDLIEEEFKSLHAWGTSTSLGLDAIYPIIRSRLKNLYLSFFGDHKTFNNKSSGVTSTQYQSHSGSMSLNGNMFDKIGGGGANSAGLTVTQGYLDLDRSPNHATDQTTTKTDGHFTKLRYFISRQQLINNILSFFVSFTGQAANKNLDSSEKFYLGGPNGVRAYPVNEGGGAQGQLLNCELRAQLPLNFSLTGFYDWGHVAVNKRNDISGAATPNHISLQGSGASLGWTASNGINVKATWALRSGKNPNPTSAGYDQDGSLDKNRYWFQVTIPF